MFSRKLLAALALVTSSVFGQTDISSLPGPFELVTTADLSVPVVPSSYLVLYYNTLNNNRNSGLTLSSTSFTVSYGETFRLLNGVLGTTYRPDDVVGDQPWNATTPASNGYLTFSNQSVAHAGLDLINGTFLAVHGIIANTWYLCTDSVGFGVLTYQASSSRTGCTPTYVAVYTPE